MVWSYLHLVPFPYFLRKKKILVKFRNEMYTVCNLNNSVLLFYGHTVYLRKEEKL